MSEANCIDPDDYDVHVQLAMMRPRQPWQDGEAWDWVYAKANERLTRAQLSLAVGQVRRHARRAWSRRSNTSQHGPRRAERRARDEH